MQIMRTPSTREWKHLYGICPCACVSFPAQVQDNHKLFADWLGRAGPGDLDTLWGLLSLAHQKGLAVYYTATLADQGFRIGNRTPANPAAAPVWVTIRFPADQSPQLRPSPGWVGHRLDPAKWYQLFARGKKLSQEALAFRNYLMEQAPVPPAIKRNIFFLRRRYDHQLIKRSWGPLMPSSHPVGGLLPGSCAETCQSIWQL
jgi:hypothetical protein